MPPDNLELKLTPWCMNLSWCLDDCFFNRQRRPGQFWGAGWGGRRELWNLSDDIVRHCILPFLLVRDIIYMESLTTEGRLVAVLHDHVRSAELKICRRSAYQALAWLCARKISPPRLVLTSDITSVCPLSALSALLRDTQSLVLKGSLPVDSIICVLSQLSPLHLCELRLMYGYNMNQSVLHEARRFSGLKVWHFSLDGETCSLDCISETLEALPLLRDLGLHVYSVPFTLQQAETFGMRCRKLISLTICQLQAQPRSLLAVIARNLSGLQSLHASYFDSYAADDVRGVVQYCGELRRLTLGGWQLSTADLAAAMDRLPLLQYLDVSSMRECNYALITAVAAHCSQLQELHIDGCSAVTDAAILALIDHGTPLLVLTCRFCPHITPPALEALHALRPALRITYQPRGQMVGCF